MNNPLILFLQELVLRFSAKSPKFFVVLAWISGALVAITAVPEFLSFMEIPIPEIYQGHLNIAVKWASRAALFVSLLTARGKTVAVDQNRIPIKQTNLNKLPFTTKVEAKAVEKEIADTTTPPVDTVVLQNPVVPKEKK